MTAKTLRLCAACADKLRDIRGLALYRLHPSKIVCPECGKKRICDEYAVTKPPKRPKT